MGIGIPTSFSINAIVWITSLRPDEVGSTDRVLDTVIPYLQTIKMPLTQLEPKSADELLAMLDALAHQARTQRLRPLIHIDTHGDETKGLYVVDSKEFVSWSEISKKFRAINIALNNNLCVVSAACFGFEVVNQVSITEPSPFFICIGPEKKVTIGFVEAGASRFYEEIFRTGDIIHSYNRYLRSDFKIYHCEKMLALAIAKYMKNKCFGKGGEERRERLLTEILQQPGAINNRTTRRALRQSMKKTLRPSQTLVDRYVRQFMLGRKVAFSFNDLMALVRDMK